MNPTVAVFLVMMISVLTVVGVILYSDYRQRVKETERELSKASILIKVKLPQRKHILKMLQAIDELDKESQRKRMLEKLQAIGELDRESQKKRMREVLEELKKVKEIPTEGRQFKTTVGRVRT